MKKNINNVYIPEVYLMWGVSDLINPDLKKIIDETNKKINKNLDSKFSNLILLNMKLIRKTPDMIISKRAFVCLVELSVKGCGNSIPNK